LSDRDDLYDSYLAFKAWDDHLVEEPNEFGIEVARAGIEPPANVLEIGFGQGRFLSWARERHYDVIGVELIPELVKRASARGFTVYQGRIECIPVLKERKFDLIAAFDVFEHLTRDDLVALLKLAKQILKPTGKVLARFPNGGSPFGLPYQCGDATHLTALGAGAMTQIAIAAGMRVLWIGNAARPTRSGKHLWVTMRIGHLLRDTIEILLGKIYFHGVRCPLDPNLTAVLGHAVTET
jgi:SAM-dependent methyltransferase